ncbi:hypothetical protein, conserved, partial [Entamoeba dispar SAW760]
MITSMYFDDIKDFINLEIGVKRFQGNMERFHFNPIPLDEYSRKFFPNIETFHIYNKYDDEIFDDGKIFKYVIWSSVEYPTYLKEKEAGNICKKIIYTEEDREKYGNTIPSEVSIIGHQCFYNCEELTTINIPTRVNQLWDFCFEGCSSLTSITIPPLVSFIGDECFNLCYSLKSINIPPLVTELGIRCFYECSSLTSINIPLAVIEIGKDCFYGCSSLTSMSIDKVHFISENKIFMNEPVLISIEIPYNLQIINGKNIEKKDINEFIIPSSITKLGNSCFKECYSLSSINIPTTVSELGWKCFKWCSLKSINIPTTITKFGNSCFYRCGCTEELKKNER